MAAAEVEEERRGHEPACGSRRRRGKRGEERPQPANGNGSKPVSREPRSGPVPPGLHLFVLHVRPFSGFLRNCEVACGERERQHGRSSRFGNRAPAGSRPVTARASSRQRGWCRPRAPGSRDFPRCPRRSRLEWISRGLHEERSRCLAADRGRFSTSRSDANSYPEKIARREAECCDRLTCGQVRRE